MKSPKLYSAILLSLSTFAAANNTKSQPSTPKVHIQNGTISGKYVATYDQDLFLGIPFAQPPVGELRFNLPKPLSKTWNKTLDATEYGPICLNYPLGVPVDPKNITYPQSEDCLSLNVIRPANATSTSRLPVLVWIYGGGYQEGGSAEQRYNGSFIVHNSVRMGQPIIQVSFNYRLAGWGLLAGEDMKGQGVLNAALHDQRIALQWVQENIEAFGGDKSKVTIQGESAGAASVGFQLLAYGGRDDGLFHAAICESGGPFYFGRFPKSSQSEASYQTLLNATNCTAALDTVSCLRFAPQDILDATIAKLSFFPVVDGSFISEFNSVALAEGNFVRVPLLIGANTDEGRLFAGYGVNTTEEFRSFLSTDGYVTTTSNVTVDLAMDAYPIPSSNTTYGQSDDTIQPSYPYGRQFTRAARFTGDAMFIAGRRYACQVWTKYGVPCYSYRFNTIPGDTDPVTLGATHFEEVAFVFDNVIGTGVEFDSYNVSPADRKRRYKALGQLMSRMWVSFAGTQNPNNHEIESFTTLWPKYSLENATNIVFDGNATGFVEKDDWRQEAMRFHIDRALAYGR